MGFRTTEDPPSPPRHGAPAAAARGARTRRVDVLVPAASEPAARDAEGRGRVRPPPRRRHTKGGEGDTRAALGVPAGGPRILTHHGALSSGCGAPKAQFGGRWAGEMGASGAARSPAPRSADRGAARCRPWKQCHWRGARGSGARIAWFQNLWPPAPRARQTFRAHDWPRPRPPPAL